MVLIDPRTKTVQSKDAFGRLPQPKDYRGVLVASAVIGLWSSLFYHCMFHIKLIGDNPSSLWHVLAAFAALEFLYTGLFITTHDAMHGSISFRNRALNDFLGQLAISLYAWFDYEMLHKAHWEHHDHTGQVHKDPDFHRGDPSLMSWFGNFMCHYLSWTQILKIGAWTAFLLSVGAPVANILVFMTVAPLLSAFRLFYYGTYVPHLPDDKNEVMNWEKSHTSNASRLLSMLKCYHFDYHWEHHRWPYSPWWQLPEYRALTRKAAEAKKAK